MLTVQKSKGAEAHLPEGKTLEGFARNLKYWRLMRGYTHRDLGLVAEKNPSTISYLENAKVCPTPRTVYDLAIALGVTPATLWG